MTLDALPDEIIQHLLLFVPPSDTLENLQYVSRRFRRLVDEPLVWRYHCVTRFKYWHPSHRFHEKLRQPVQQVDWKELFNLRKIQNSAIAVELNGIIRTKTKRFKRYGLIGQYGYDAKDFLLEQLHVDICSGDGLARRYYAQSVLDSIHRSVGIEQWHALIDPTQPSPTLEKALGAFDMFVLDPEADGLDEVSRCWRHAMGVADPCSQISSILDDKAQEFREASPGLAEMTLRQRALCLNRWVRAHDLVGLKHPERDYRNLRNCLIGQALRHEEHESIPIISGAIYCALAQRIGLNAQCCNFPGHIHVVVTAPAESTLDGVAVAEPKPEIPDRMYLDPFGLEEEVPIERLRSLLSRFGGPDNPDIERAVQPARAVAIINRIGANMSQTFATASEQSDNPSNEIFRLICGSNSQNLVACLYASMWAALILTHPDTWAELDFFLTRYTRSFPEDAWLVEKFLVPRQPHRRVHVGRHANTVGAWDPLRNNQYLDMQGAWPVRRDKEGGDKVPFKIGQVFRHKRYQWLGVITGWSDHVSRTRRQTAEANVDTDANPLDRLRMHDQTYFMYM